MLLLVLTPAGPSLQGGTADELWSSREALAKCTDPENKTNAAWSGLWNGNIVPLLNTTIKVRPMLFCSCCCSC